MHLLDLLFPPTCAGCGKWWTHFCPYCLSQLQLYSDPIEIQVKNPSLDQLFSAAVYQSPLSQLIKQLKYKFIKNSSQICAEIIFHGLSLPAVDLITFVPLHKNRQNERGFNQAEQIAQRLSKLTNIPCLPTLTKTKHTPNQASLKSIKQRKKNVQETFSPLKNIPTELNQLSCWLVDDVTTTGSTLNECASVLKQIGFAKVIGVTVAHGV